MWRSIPIERVIRFKNELKILTMGSKNQEKLDRKLSLFCESLCYLIFKLVHYFVKNKKKFKK